MYLTISLILPIPKPLLKAFGGSITYPVWEIISSIPYIILSFVLNFALIPYLFRDVGINGYITALVYMLPMFLVMFVGPLQPIYFNVWAAYVNLYAAATGHGPGEVGVLSASPQNELAWQWFGTGVSEVYYALLAFYAIPVAFAV